MRRHVKTIFSVVNKLSLKQNGRFMMVGHWPGNQVAALLSG